MKSTLLVGVSSLILARTVLAECGVHSFTSCADNIVHWFDPNTGEVCDPLDCGGGRAPPRTDVPGCPLYTGTETRSTSYLSCWTPSVSASSTVATASASSTESVGSSDSTSTSDAASSESSATATVARTATGSSATPATTLPPKSSTGLRASSSDTSSTGGSTVQPAPTNAGALLTGSLMAVAGAAVGAIVLI
ncbi:Glycoside hydrolase 18 protein [Penicillium hispanicum]|uniref:Glycoside hydrolase 18 protein n=1 Tax=Penicillium hispanicum TaxID=1080232 RepID=UPI0025409F1E|nr:Glycoside hydrolase 18 protein [Penicillium hispanicum]KAJ5595489.1 Glycoside hydrolase 18 protein [Penicillium hispanicum]